MNASDASAILEPSGLAALNSAHRILVAEDDPTLRRLTAEMLTSVGHRVDAAQDGAAAWEALNRASYDLLITDHQMPQLTGVELLKKLYEADMAIPAILVSGMIPTEELADHPQLQIDAMLLKPYTAETFLWTVESVLHDVPSRRRQESVAHSVC